MITLESSGITESVREEINAQIQSLNEKVCVVKTLNRVVELSTGRLMKREDFCGIGYSSSAVPYRPVGAKNDRHIKIAPLWLLSKQRNEAHGAVCEPGESKFMIINGQRMVNLWPGMGCTPEAGPVEPWLRLLGAAVKSEVIRHWVVSWLAYPLRNPGAKLGSLLYLLGESGSGKSIFLAPVMSIYGKNAIETTGIDLRRDFLNRMADKQLCLFKSPLLAMQRLSQGFVSALDRMMFAESFPTAISNRSSGTVEYKNHVNVILTSRPYNQFNGLDSNIAGMVKWLPDKDSVDPLIVECANWMSAGGPAFLYNYLLRYDTAGFSSHGRPLRVAQ